jgi:hypothetical protein
VQKQEAHQGATPEKERGERQERKLFMRLNDTITKKALAENYKGGIVWLQKKIRLRIGRKI